jgi:hypothetical protein
MQTPVELSFPSNVASRKALLVFAWLLSIGVCTSGCGNALYAWRVNAAASKLEEARNAGAEQRAPYQYTMAKEHLDKAMSEAAEADYGDAYELAGAAYDYAEEAVQRCTQNPGNANAVNSGGTAR